MVLGVGRSNGAITRSIKSKMVAGGHLGMMALSRVTLVSAGLSYSGVVGMLAVLHVMVSIAGRS